MITAVQTLSEQQKEMLEKLGGTSNFYEVIDSCGITEDTIKFWCETNFVFNEEYLKAIGITRSQERFLKAYPKKLFNVSATCRAVGIHRSTYYDWLDKSDTFRCFAHDVKEELYDNLETIMYKKALEGDNRMLIFIAKTQMRDRGYGDNPVTTNTNIYISPYEQKLQNMTIEELDAEIKLMDAKATS